MRREDKEIKDYTKMLEVVEDCDCCRIGLVDDSSAYIVPMNFGYEHVDNDLILYFHSAIKGKKIDLIEKQKIASFEMDTNHGLISGRSGCSYSFSFQSILGKGKIEIIKDKDMKVHALKKILQHYTDKDNWEFEDKVLEITAVIKLTVKEWTCKEN